MDDEDSFYAVNLAPEMIKTFLLRILMTLLGKLPLAVVQRCGSALGQLSWTLRTRPALVTRENIQRCYPTLDPERQKALVTGSMRETGKTFLELAISWTAPVSQCRNYIVAVDGKAAVDALFAKGDGLIFIIPHLGNYELIHHFLGQNYDLTHMYQPNDNPALNAYILDCRLRTGTHLVPSNNSGIKAQLSNLRQGKSIGVMPDQEPGIHTGEFAAFFNLDALTNNLVPGLAAKTGAATVVTYIRRLKNAAGFKVVFDVIELGNEAGISALEKMNEGIERAVREVPEQYLWSYKRFRTRPGGEVDFYQFNQKPIRTWAGKLIYKTALNLCRFCAYSQLRLMARLISPAAPFFFRRKFRFTAINLKLCQQNAGYLKKSMLELLLTGLEVGKIWYASDNVFESLCLSVKGNEYLSDVNSSSGVLVLTPPMGNREVIMRYLSNHYPTTEYYHPNSIFALDGLIRSQRQMAGTKIVEHSDTGRTEIIKFLDSGRLALLCPDQQPRLRGGIFAPFYGVAALTTLAIPEILRRSGASMVFAYTTREKSGFNLHFERCELDPDFSDLDLLTAVNRQLEEIIAKAPTQYRWSDKRFNIRPKGSGKVYRW